MKQFVLCTLGATVLSAGLFACGNKVSLQDVNEQAIKSRTIEDVAIAQDDPASNGLILLFDSAQKKKDLVKEGIFAEVESIEVGEGFLAIIGKEINTYELVAFQVELLKIDDKYYYPNPSNPDLPVTTFAKHKCNGVSCSSCEFTREGSSKLSRITGCKCKEKADQDSRCDHEITAEELSDTAKDILTIAISIIGIFK